jgi:hypothetical protein
LIYYAVPSKGVEIPLEVEPSRAFTIQITNVTELNVPDRVPTSLRLGYHAVTFQLILL